VAKRTIVSLVALPIVLAPVWLGGVWSVLLALCVALLGSHELYNLMERGHYRPTRWIGLPWAMLLVLHYAQAPGALNSTLSRSVLSLSTLITVGLIVALIVSLFQMDHPMNTWMSTSTGAIYMGVLTGQMLGLRLMENGLWWLLLSLLVTWSNDTAAYFTGISIGRHKLWPRLSPKKTWEGTLGGWLAAVLIGGLAASWMPLPIAPAIGTLVGFGCGVLALLGDLAVSMLKRQVHVKDSGRLLPGHGGVLDRMDSLLFAIPFVYQAALFLN